jgi:hypothetical protein
MVLAGITGGGQPNVIMPSVAIATADAVLALPNKVKDYGACADGDMALMKQMTAFANATFARMWVFPTTHTTPQTPATAPPPTTDPSATIVLDPAIASTLSKTVLAVHILIVRLSNITDRNERTDRYGARFQIILHSRMPLVPMATAARLKLLHACDQYLSSRSGCGFLTGWCCK